MADHVQHPILFYDGICGLCNGLVQFLLKRDAKDRLRFAALQSKFAQDILRQYDHDPKDLDTVYLVLDQNRPTERVLARAEAIITALEQLGGVWRLAVVMKLLPNAIRDAAYNFVARRRYRLFGKHETCFLPSAEYRHKFLDG